MVKEVCSRLKITIKMHNIKFMKRTMPKMSTRSQSLNQLKIIKIKSILKMDNINLMKKTVIILLLKNKKKNMRLLMIGKD
jgi:hypothetical protein